MKTILHGWLRNFLAFRSCMVILLLTACEAEKQEPLPLPVALSGDFGALEGIVRLAGNELPQPTRVANTTDPKVCGQMQTLEDFLVSAETRGIRNVIVALKDVPASKIPASRPRRLILDNRECKFVPHVSVVTVGSAIQAINSDPTLHNTHFYGAINANIALAFKGVKRTTRVAKPGMIIVKCDVHGWMQAFIRADSHPFHAVTDENGHFRIPNIPAGTYNLEIWHEKLGVLEKTVAIDSTKTKTLAVEYSLNNH